MKNARADQPEPQRWTRYRFIGMYNALNPGEKAVVAAVLDALAATNKPERLRAQPQEETNP